MKKNIKKVVSLLLVLAMMLVVGCQGNNTKPASAEPTPAVEDSKIRFIESDGTELMFDKIPERIVVLSVATAEIMHKLGIPLVGMTSTSRELSEGLRNLPEVGIPMRPDMEKIAELTPDLVIMSSNFKAANKDNFDKFGIKTYFLDNQKYSDTQKSIELLAKAFGKEDKVDDILKPIKFREEAILNSIKDKEKPTVMVIFGTSEAFSMARDNSFAGEMVKILGANNVTDTLKVSDDLASMIPLSIEQVVELNPQVILRIAHGNPREVTKLYEKEFATNPIWKEIDAVKNNRVHDLSTELFFANPGLTAIDSLEELVKILFP